MPHHDECSTSTSRLLLQLDWPAAGRTRIRDACPWWALKPALPGPRSPRDDTCSIKQPTAFHLAIKPTIAFQPLHAALIASVASTSCRRPACPCLCNPSSPVLVEVNAASRTRGNPGSKGRGRGHGRHPQEDGHQRRRGRRQVCLRRLLCRYHVHGKLLFPAAHLALACVPA